MKKMSFRDTYHLLSKPELLEIYELSDLKKIETLPDKPYRVKIMKDLGEEKYTKIKPIDLKRRECDLIIYGDEKLGNNIKNIFINEKINCSLFKNVNCNFRIDNLNFENIISVGEYNTSALIANVVNTNEDNIIILSNIKASGIVIGDYKTAGLISSSNLPVQLINVNTDLNVMGNKNTASLVSEAKNIMVINSSISKDIIENNKHIKANERLLFSSLDENSNSLINIDECDEVKEIIMKKTLKK